MTIAAPLRPARSVLLALMVLGLAACAGGRGDEVRVTAEPAAASVPPLDGLALRIENEDEKARLKLAAIANALLTRRGIRPDPLAPEVLVLDYNRPRRLAGHAHPNIGIGGRIGSSSKGSVGIVLGLPWWGPSAEPEPAPHTMTARLEQVSPAVLLWRGEARVDAIPEDGIDNDLAERLIRELLDALEAARRADRKKSP